MASPFGKNIKITGLRERLDSKYKEDVQKFAKQLETLDKTSKETEILFGKTFCDFRLLIAKDMPEAEMIAKGQPLYNILKKNRKFGTLPAELRNELTHCFEDNNASQKEQAIATGATAKPSSPKRGQEGNRSVDSGPAPKQSSHSPKMTHTAETPGKAHNDQVLEKMQKQIEKLTKELTGEQEKGEQQQYKLDDREKQLKDHETAIETKDKKIKELEEEAADLAKRLESEKLKCTKATEYNAYNQKIMQQLEQQVNEYSSQELAYKKTFEGMKAEFKRLEKEKSQIEKARQRDVEHLQNEMKEERRKFDDQYKKLALERDDLRDRFSKLAGAKLQEQNADIADLSDPNRAMKLSEKFGQIYDDEWTNAFECLIEKKTGLPLKDAIAFLLRLLQDCWSNCNTLLTGQMESLNNVFLHPAQDLAKIDSKKHATAVGKEKKGKGLKDQSISSKNGKTLLDLRRQIAVSPSVIEEVKQACLSESKFSDKEKTGYPKKHIEACVPYIQKCAEICWLMAVHDPPLYMKMEVKPGEKFDPAIYSAYSSSGHSIDFLVWPPLLNGKDGGLLAKGVAEPLRTVGKKK